MINRNIASKTFRKCPIGHVTTSLSQPQHPLRADKDFKWPSFHLQRPLHLPKNFHTFLPTVWNYRPLNSRVQSVTVENNCQEYIKVVATCIWKPPGDFWEWLTKMPQNGLRLKHFPKKVKPKFHKSQIWTIDELPHHNLLQSIQKWVI